MISPPSSRSMQWRATIRRFAAALLLALGSMGAYPHAIVVSSQPSAGSVLARKDIPVEVRFNSRIDHRHSRLFLFGPDGKRSELTVLDLTHADTLVADAGKLAPGQYRLRWQVMSVDGHITRGDIRFTVAR